MSDKYNPKDIKEKWKKEIEDLTKGVFGSYSDKYVSRVKYLMGKVAEKLGISHTILDNCNKMIEKIGLHNCINFNLSELTYSSAILYINCAIDGERRGMKKIIEILGIGYNSVYSIVRKIMLDDRFNRNYHLLLG